MTDVTNALDEELEEEMRNVTARVIVWLAVAAGIGMAVLQVVRQLQKKKSGSSS